MKRSTKKRFIDAVTFGAVAGVTWAVAETLVRKLGGVKATSVSGAVGGFLDDAKNFAVDIYDGVIGTEVAVLPRDADKGKAS